MMMDDLCAKFESLNLISSWMSAEYLMTVAKKCGPAATLLSHQQIIP